MAIRIQIAISLCLALIVAPAFAQNPIGNPDFEGGLDAWTAYSYQPSPGALPATPVVGCVGGSECVFNLISPPSAPSGNNVCGIQSFESTGNGGVCQSFTWQGGAASISVTARAYSQRYDGTPYDNGCRIRMGLASGQTQNRNSVQSWLDFPWGDVWRTRTLQIPAAGSYTIFIEADQPNTSAIMSTLWDKVEFTSLPPVLTTIEPTVTRDPNNPDTAVIISWSTNVASSSVIEYGPTDSYNRSAGSATPAMDHNVTISGLVPSTQYFYRITSAAPGYLSYVSDGLSFRTPIWFSNVITKVDPSGAIVVEWQTDIPSTSQVEYWINPDQKSSSNELESLTTKHTVNLGILSEANQYSFRVWSRRPGYTDAKSEVSTFWTLPPISWELVNGDFEDTAQGQGHTLSPWVQYTTQEGVSGYHPIDGLVGPYSSSGTSTWLTGIKAYNGSYFLGAGANMSYKNGGVFQRVYVDPGDFYTLSTRFITYQSGGEAGYTHVKIGVDPNGGVDPGSSNIRWWQGYSFANDSSWQPAAVTITAGESGIATVFLEFEQLFSLKWHVSAIDGVRFESPTPTKIGSLKSSTGGLGGIIEDRVVTYIDPHYVWASGRTCYKVYIQEDDRSAGIAVLLPLGSGPAPQLKRGITVTGSLGLHNMEAVIYAAYWSLGTTRLSLPKPLAMPQSSLGHAGVNQPSITGKTKGLSTVGLRVRVFGRVTWIDPNDGAIYIDDGSAILDGTKTLQAMAVRGIRTHILNKPASTPQVGDYIAVTGVLGVELIDPDNWPDPTDYHVYSIYTNSPNDWDLLFAAP